MKFVTPQMSFELDECRHVVVPLDGADLKLAAEIATRRRAHKQASFRDSKRLYGNAKKEDLTGAMCEIAFAKWSGLAIDAESYVGGDCGWDFESAGPEGALKIDVKGFDKPKNLFLRVDTPLAKCADVYVLAAPHKDNTSVALLGHEDRDILRDAPTRVFNRALNHNNYFIAQEKLRPMEDLKQRLVPISFDDPHWLELAL